jgi:hypothetical protein
MHAGIVTHLIYLKVIIINNIYNIKINMLNSFVARTAPQIFSANATFLNRVMNPALY